MLHKLGVQLRRYEYRWAGGLLLFGMLERLVCFLVYQPIVYSDTNAYLRLANPLTALTLKGYDGTRVPGYPALLAIAGMNEHNAWIIQLALGLAISLLLFWITYKTTDSAALGALVGGLYDLIPGQFLFESNLLSETLTTFFVVLCFASFVAFGGAKSSQRRLLAVFMLGITATLPGMVRPYDDVAEIRDTYIKFRDAQIAERGVQTNAIWEAIPAMSEASGLGFYDLSRELQKLSLELIRAHPDLYFANVVEGWVDFWKAPVYWRAETLHLPILVSTMQILIWIGRAVSILANLVFLLTSALALLSKRLRRRIGFDVYSAAASSLVIMISIVQTLVDHGDNPRFLVPLQMIVFYVVIRSVWYALKTRGVTEAT
ncbi:MAG: hypothetical protein P8Z42_07030 [Anaerolineales bacterium]